MHVYGELSGVLTPAGTLSGTLSAPVRIQGNLTIPEVMQPYTGSYEVTPSNVVQTLPTQNKALSEDITVGAVADGSATVSGSATVNPILSVDNEGVITATVSNTLSVTPTVQAGYISEGTTGSLVLTGNAVQQLYKRTSDDLSVNAGTVTAPFGYYPENASKTISLKPTVLRPDAQLVQSYTFDQWAVDDLELTIPAYTTTAQSLKATSNLSPTITVDATTETFFVVEKFLTIPEYSITTKAKGRQEYTYCVYFYELARVPANTVYSIDRTGSVTSATNIIATMSTYRELYWSTASALTLYGSNGYGCYQTPTAPTFSGSTLTIKAPVLGVRGSTSYFTSTFMNALTDIRYQYIIDVYKAPKEALGIDGWITNEAVNHILECANSTTHKLT